MFNEITKNAIQKAFEKPLAVNLHLVDAQQARRILDRLVGYKISPLLWDKVRRGLVGGARADGRAAADCGSRARDPRVHEARILDHRRQSGGEEASAAVGALGQAGRRKRRDRGRSRERSRSSIQLDGAAYVVKSVVNKEKRRHPVPPFITSTLQQEAARKLRFSVKRTMMLAQRLYEGVELGSEEGSVGLISYMRTDSTRVSNEALDEVRAHDHGALRRGLPAGDAERL